MSIHQYLAFESGLSAKKFLFSWQLVIKGQNFFAFFSPGLLKFIQAWLFFFVVKFWSVKMYILLQLHFYVFEFILIIFYWNV